jgi:hypothetical protein
MKTIGFETLLMNINEKSKVYREGVENFFVDFCGNGE